MLFRSAVLAVLALSALRFVSAWDAPAACLGAEELESFLVREAEHGAISATRNLQGSITAIDAGFELTIEVFERDEARGQRTLALEGTDCSTHTQAIRLVALLLLERGTPTARSGPTLTAPSAAVPQLELSVEANEDPSASALVPVEPAARDRVRVVGHRGVMVGWGRSPRLSFSVGAGLVLAEHLWLDLLVDYFGAGQTGPQWFDVNARGWGGRLRACGQWGMGRRMAFGLCGGFGLLHVDWDQNYAPIGNTWHFSRLGAYAALDAELVLLRIDYFSLFVQATTRLLAPNEFPLPPGLESDTVSLDAPFLNGPIVGGGGVGLAFTF